MDELKFDEIGYWSEIKLDIIREYAKAYSTILSAQPRFKHIYIDGFAGAGVHKSRATGELVTGSPANALRVRPAFSEYHFIDLNRKKIASLERLADEREDVFIYHGDCNRVLLSDIFPRARFEDYRRGLCILDPYGLDLEWQVIAQAGAMRSIDLFINFPVLDMNRNVLWRNREGVSAVQIKRMSSFWGDDGWRSLAYRDAPQQELFGPSREEKVENAEVAAAFRERLKTVAGFAHVPEPIAMRNSKNAVVYYLYFAAHKPVAAKVVNQIFEKYRHRTT